MKNVLFIVLIFTFTIGFSQLDTIQVIIDSQEFKEYVSSSQKLENKIKIKVSNLRKPELHLFLNKIDSITSVFQNNSDTSSYIDNFNQIIDFDIHKYTLEIFSKYDKMFKLSVLSILEYEQSKTLIDSAILYYLSPKKDSLTDQSKLFRINSFKSDCCQACDSELISLLGSITGSYYLALEACAFFIINPILAGVCSVAATTAYVAGILTADANYQSCISSCDGGCSSGEEDEGTN